MMLRLGNLGIRTTGKFSMLGQSSNAVFKRFNSTHDWSKYPARGPTNWKTPSGKLRLEYLMLQAVTTPEMEARVTGFIGLMLSRVKTYREDLKFDGPWKILGPVATMKVAKIMVLFKILMDNQLVNEWSDFMDFLDENGYETTSQDIGLVGNFIADWLGVNSIK